MNLECKEIDKYLFSRNWYKFEETPVYYKYDIEEDCYRIIFDPNFRDYTLITEKFIKERKLSEKQINKELSNMIAAVYCTTISKELNYTTLLMLKADFYWHLSTGILIKESTEERSIYEKTINKYNKLSRRDYETGKLNKI